MKILIDKIKKLDKTQHKEMKTKKNRRTVERNAREREIRRAKDYKRLKEWSDSEATIEKSGGTNVHSECWPAFTYCIVRRTTNCVAPVRTRRASKFNFVILRTFEISPQIFLPLCLVHVANFLFVICCLSHSIGSF